MSLQIYDTRYRKKVKFLPIESGKVKIYVCGVTVYDDCHVGHGRAYVTFDLIVRYLRYLGFEVTYVRNITDIDDKIIDKARQMPGEEDLMHKVDNVTQKYSDQFNETMSLLDVAKPDEEPRATQHIPKMIQLIESLIEKKVAYQVDGDVYFDIQSWEPYGALSGRTLKELKSGARVEVDPRKKNPMDFALWKKSKEGEPAWPSPWGEGRPGWHLECSAMSMEYFGTPFDIHGGGQDLIFPHHENELAQSEAATGKEFVRYWIHNGFVTVDKEKMSKSLGNFFVLKDVFQKFSPELVRYYYLTQHYRGPMEFSDAVLESCQEGYRKLQSCFSLTDLYVRKNEIQPLAPITEDKKTIARFKEAMDDDFNTPKALALLHEIVGEINTLRETGKLKKEHFPKINAFHKMMDLLGIKFVGSADFVPKSSEKLSVDQIEELLGKTELSKQEIDLLAQQREILRQEKKFALADEIRNKIDQSGYNLEDTPDGPRIQKKD